MRTVTQYIFAFSFSKTDGTVQFKSRKGLNVKDICSVLSERFVNDKIIEMTGNAFEHYQSTIISRVDSVTIEEARDCV